MTAPACSPACSPTCSIVIPWHRNLDDLRQAVDSVFAQSVQDFEVIVVANGVGDDAWAAAAALRPDPRYRAVRLATAGASPARNHGLALASGDLVFFLDADDVFFEGKLERVLAAHRDTGFDVAFSRGVRERGNGVSWAFPVALWDGTRPLSEFFFCDGGLISASAIVVSAAVRDRLRFDESCHFCEDPDLVIRAAAMGLKVEMLPDALYRWSDERTGDRLSQRPDYERRLAWIDRREGVFSEKARAGFRARCVAQHVFPRHFAQNLGYFVDALRLGAATPREVALFMLRGFLPAGPRRRLINLYFRLQERAAAPARPRRA